MLKRYFYLIFYTLIISHKHNTTQTQTHTQMQGQSWAKMVGGNTDTPRSARLLQAESRGAGQEPGGSGKDRAGEAGEFGGRGGW